MNFTFSTVSEIIIITDLQKRLKTENFLIFKKMVSTLVLPFKFRLQWDVTSVCCVLATKDLKR